MNPNSIQFSFDGSSLLNALYVAGTLLSLVFSLPNLLIKTIYGRDPQVSLILQRGEGMCPRSHSPVAEPRLALNPSLELVRGVTLLISWAGLTPGKSPRGSPWPLSGPCRPREQKPREPSPTLQAPPCRSSGTSQPAAEDPHLNPALSNSRVGSFLLSPAFPHLQSFVYLCHAFHRISYHLY